MTPKISEFDLEYTCWWCGAMVKGFNTNTGRERKPYLGHFCDELCKLEFDEHIDEE